MKRVMSYLGYGWAVLSFFIVIATFFLNPSLSRTFASITGIAISPRYTGGTVERMIDHATYTTRIHRPVFDGLLSPRKTGFIQIDWQPRAGLPEVVEEEIDINGDGRADFHVSLDTEKGSAAIIPRDPSVRDLEHLYNLGKDGFAVRVVLRKE
jgi:hypothetical protein